MPVLNDLIELNGIASNTTYTRANGGIKGVIDGATYTGDDDNSPTTIVELNDTDADGGILTIGGVAYTIQVVTPLDDRDDPVTITRAPTGTTPATTFNVFGEDLNSNIAFIRATPVSGGPVRFFAVLDDSVGNVDLTSLQTRNLDFDPAGSDVRINLTQNNDINTFICFASGTLIETVDGPRAIEDLVEGDLVLTRDNGAQPLAWVGSRHLDARDLAARPALCPIRIRAGALGDNVPSTDLIVSPQHRVLVRSNIAQTMFGTREVLVAAKQLLMIDGIDRAEDLASVTYHHMLFTDHQIVTSNGAETESLFTGPEALKGVGAAAREEILALFPELGSDEFVANAARPLVPNRMARKMASRHVQNGRALVN